MLLADYFKVPQASRTAHLRISMVRAAHWSHSLLRCRPHACGAGSPPQCTHNKEKGNSE